MDGVGTRTCERSYHQTWGTVEAPSSGKVCPTQVKCSSTVLLFAGALYSLHEDHWGWKASGSLTLIQVPVTGMVAVSEVVTE